MHSVPILDEVREPQQGAPRWQQSLREAIRDPRELCRLLDLPDRYAAKAIRAANSFPLFAPRGFVARMRRGDPFDPLLRQVLPLAEEELPAEGYSTDPVDDARATLSPGLLQKYNSRVLMVATGACAVHCRYCFRRHYPYSQSPRSLTAWQPALAQIEADASIQEVILSGGDPLTLVDELLAELVNCLSQIPHLRRLRVHSRLPIMIPERVCSRMLEWLGGTRLTPLMVVHANHPAELNEPVEEALQRLVHRGVPVLNQAVLLRGVNDSAAVLAALCERLVNLRVMPYYLHQLDRVAGAAHFAVPVDEGQRLMEQLRAKLPGYAVPRYVEETAGRAFKVPLA